MKIGKAIITIGLASIAQLSLRAVASLTRRGRGCAAEKKVPLKDLEWMLGCMDDIVLDIRSIKQRQGAQAERIARIEAALTLRGDRTADEEKTNERTAD